MLTRLLAACGFELDGQLRAIPPPAPPADDAIRAEIEYTLARTPEQRLDDLRTSDAFVKAARRLG